MLVRKKGTNKFLRLVVNTVRWFGIQIAFFWVFKKFVKVFPVILTASVAFYPLMYLSLAILH
jgi:hypothetical protein